MSSIPRAPTSPYISKDEFKASLELAKSQAFAEAQKTLGESTPQAPNTESNGNAKLTTQQTASQNAQPSPSSGQNGSSSASPPAAQGASSAPDTSASSSTPRQSNAPSSPTSSSSTQAPARDTLDTSRTNTSQSANTSGQQSSLGGQGGGNSNAGDHLALLDTSMAKDMANIASSTQVTVVRVESLGNTEAMTRELLQALRADAVVQPTATNQAAQAALAAMTQKTVDNIPHLLVDSDSSRGVKLFLPDAASTKPATTPDSRYLASESARVQATQELGHGPEWPHMMLEGLGKAQQSWHAQFPSADPLANAMMSLYGREVTVATAGAPQETLNKLASLANAPLSLPSAGLMRTDDNALTAFSVQSTHIAPEGHQLMVTVLDVPASVEAGREVYKTMEAEAFAKVVYVLVVPDGRPAVAVQREQETEFNTLGLIGCCLNSGGGGSVRTQNPMRTVATRGSGSGLLENRCVTCARAQQLCQPRAV